MPKKWMGWLILTCGISTIGEASAPPSRLLAVFAHPDDETLASGLLVRAVEAGVEVTVVYVTSGDAGKDRSGKKLSGEALGAAREGETRTALGHLGITREPRFLRFGDGKVPELEKEVLEKLIPILEELDPTVVLTFGSFGMTGHRDHIATGRITTSAFDRSGKGKHLHYTVVSRTRGEPLAAKLSQFGVEWVADNRVSEVVDCTTAVERKAAAMRSHVSQFPAVVLDTVTTWFKDLPYEEFVHARGPTVSTPLEDLLGMR